MLCLSMFKTSLIHPVIYQNERQVYRQELEGSAILKIAGEVADSFQRVVRSQTCYGDFL